MHPPDSATTHIVRNVTVPTLTVFQPKDGERSKTAVLICPGGGKAVEPGHARKTRFWTRRPLPQYEHALQMVFISAIYCLRKWYQWVPIMGRSFRCQNRNQGIRIALTCIQKVDNEP